MKKGLLAFIVPLLAIGLAGIAGLISVLGMSKLFAGQALIVMVTMAIIESGKVVGASVLHNKWKNTEYKIIKWPLLLMVIIAMTITSLGVYGFFTDAYQKTAGQFSIDKKEIELIENKKIVLEKNIETINGKISFKNKQSQNLIDLRTQQETRLDSLISNNHWVNVRRTQEQINEANNDLKVIQADIDTMYVNVGVLQDSIGKLDIQILEMEGNSEASAELGPLIYISEVFNSDMDTVVNYVMLIIMIVFDPFAMVLIVVTNKMWKKEETQKEVKTFIPTTSVSPTKKSEPLKEGLTKSNKKNPDNMPNHRNAPPPPPLKKEEPIFNREEGYDPTLVEEDNPIEDIVTKPKKSPLTEGDTITNNKNTDNPRPKLKPEYIRSPQKPKVDPEKVIKTEPRMVNERHGETKGEELDRTWRNILRERKKKRGNNGISRI